jgi:hypothetical protein
VNGDDAELLPFLAALPEAPAIIPQLAVLHGNRPVDARCPVCCHWATPLAFEARTVPGGTIPLLYQEWLAYHWHVQLHQHGVPLA